MFWTDHHIRPNILTLISLTVLITVNFALHEVTLTYSLLSNWQGKLLLFNYIVILNLDLKEESHVLLNTFFDGKLHQCTFYLALYFPFKEFLSHILPRKQFHVMPHEAAPNSCCFTEKKIYACHLRWFDFIFAKKNRISLVQLIMF